MDGACILLFKEIGCMASPVTCSINKTDGQWIPLEEDLSTTDRKDTVARAFSYALSKEKQD